MRTRIGSTLAVLVAAAGLTAGIAGPIYSAFGDSPSSPATTTVQAGRAMLVVGGGGATTMGRAM
jgi:hypothetical protein